MSKTSTVTTARRSQPSQRSQLWSGSRPSRQRGLGLIGWVVVGLIAALIATIVIRLAPVFMDNRTMVSLVRELPAGQVHGMSKSQIRETLNKRFKINNIRRLKVEDVLTIERSRGETILLLQYEERRPMFANIDLVASFDESFTYR